MTKKDLKNLDLAKIDHPKLVENIQLAIEITPDESLTAKQEERLKKLYHIAEVKFPEAIESPEKKIQKYQDKIEVYKEMISEIEDEKEKEKYQDKIEVYEEMLSELKETKPIK